MPVHRNLAATQGNLDDWILGRTARRIYTHPEVYGGAPITVFTSGGGLFTDSKGRARILAPPRVFTKRGGTLLERVVYFEAITLFKILLNDPGFMNVDVCKDPLDWNYGLTTFHDTYRSRYPDIKKRYARNRCALCKGPATPCMKRHAKGWSCP